MITSRTTTSLRRLAALGVLTVVGGILAVPAQAIPTPPQLSIAVDDGQPAAEPKAKLSYLVTVTNLGSKPVTDLTISQSIPDGARLVSADPEAGEKADAVSWQVDLRPGKTATMQTTMAVSEELPGGLLRLATVACARTSAKAPPLVCASDSNQLPAGQAADQQRSELEKSTSGAGAWWPWPGAIVLGGAVLALALGAVSLLRRRHRPTGLGSGGVPADDHPRAGDGSPTDEPSRTSQPVS